MREIKRVKKKSKPSAGRIFLIVLLVVLCLAFLTGAGFVIYSLAGDKGTSPNASTNSSTLTDGEGGVWTSNY